MIRRHATCDCTRSATFVLRFAIWKLAISHEASYAVAYVGGCCHPPLADSASCVPPLPGRRAPGVWKRSINGGHAVASSGCLWRCLSRSASKNSRNVLYCAAIASLIARNSFVASVSIVDSFHFKWGAYFRRNQSSLFYRLSY